MMRTTRDCGGLSVTKFGSPIVAKQFRDREPYTVHCTAAVLSYRSKPCAPDTNYWPDTYFDQLSELVLTAQHRITGHSTQEWLWIDQDSTHGLVKFLQTMALCDVCVWPQ